MLQDHFLNVIAKQLPGDITLISAIADTLEISYPSAQRRVSNSAKFSFEEAIILAKAYNISLDLLYDTGDNNTISVHKTEVITGIKDFEAYFLRSTKLLEPLLAIPNVKITYAAKDLPIFYTSEGVLAKFKLFVWLKILDPDFTINNFDMFKLPASVIKAYSNFGKLYRNLPIDEFWDVTTINSILKQLDFYKTSGIISKENALTICDELIVIIKSIQQKTTPESNFKIYYNELLLMSNSVLIETPIKNSVFVPFSVVNYFNTSDPLTCKQFSKTIKYQMNHSKLLNTSGEKEKSMFFNRLLQKVTNFKVHIEAENEFGF